MDGQPHSITVVDAGGALLLDQFIAARPPAKLPGIQLAGAGTQAATRVWEPILPTPMP
jgi:hypothetical protein